MVHSTIGDGREGLEGAFGADPVLLASLIEPASAVSPLTGDDPGGRKVYRHWSPADNARLLTLRSDGLTRREIAAELGRSFRAVKHKLCR